VRDSESARDNARRDAAVSRLLSIITLLRRDHPEITFHSQIAASPSLPKDRTYALSFPFHPLCVAETKRQAGVDRLVSA